MKLTPGYMPGPSCGRLSLDLGLTTPITVALMNVPPENRRLLARAGGQVGFAVGVAPRDIVEIGLYGEKRVEHDGVEMRAAALPHDRDRFLARHGRLVDAPGDERVVHVRDRHEPRRHRYRFAGESLRIAAPVPLLL